MRLLRTYGRISRSFLFSLSSVRSFLVVQSCSVCFVVVLFDVRTDLLRFFKFHYSGLYSI